MEKTTKLSADLGALLAKYGHVLTTAESCTGGGVATAITDIAGSSGWLDRAFVTYSNEAKMEMLGVRVETLEEHGAVSEPVVIEMVQGALQHSNATIGVSISGVAGPGEAVMKSRLEPSALLLRISTTGSLLRPCIFLVTGRKFVNKR